MARTPAETAFPRLATIVVSKNAGIPSASQNADAGPRPAGAPCGHPHQVEQFPSQWLPVALQGPFDESRWLSQGITSLYECIPGT
jgi:hypothetical protein